MSYSDIVELLGRVYDEEFRRLDSIVALGAATFAPLGVAIAMTGFLWGTAVIDLSARPGYLPLFLLGVSTILCAAAIHLAWQVAKTRHLAIYRANPGFKSIVDELTPQFEPVSLGNSEAEISLINSVTRQKVLRIFIDAIEKNAREIDHLSETRAQLTEVTYLALSFVSLAALAIILPLLHKKLEALETCGVGNSTFSWALLLSGC